MTPTAFLPSPMAATRAVLLGAALLVLQGCGMVYKSTGDVLMVSAARKCCPT